MEIDHPGAIIIRDGIAVFLEPVGRPNVFDHDSVNKILAGSENASL